jgi:hypothetical protein
MSVGLENLASAGLRREDRDEVHYRARALGADSRQHMLLIVNISPHGLMGRCDAGFEAGERLQLPLPFIGTIPGQVRWSLGGRVGCEFGQPIDRAGYYEMVAAMLRGK